MSTATLPRSDAPPTSVAANPDFSQPVARPKAGVFKMLGEVLEHGGPGFFSARILSVLVTAFGGFGALATNYGTSLAGNSAESAAVATATAATNSSSVPEPFAFTVVGLMMIAYAPRRRRGPLAAANQPRGNRSFGMDELNAR